MDPQGTDSSYHGLGLVAMLYFSKDGQQIDVEYYSTIENAHFLEENQFEMEVSVVEPGSIVDNIHFGKVAKVETLEPSCLTAGNTEQYICVCGKRFRDAEATIPLNESVNIQPLGHNGKDTWLSDKDAHYHYCDRCVNNYGKRPHLDKNGDESCDACGYNEPMHTPLPTVKEDNSNVVIITACALLLLVSITAVTIIKKKSKI